MPTSKEIADLLTTEKFNKLLSTMRQVRHDGRLTFWQEQAIGRIRNHFDCDIPEGVEGYLAFLSDYEAVEIAKPNVDISELEAQLGIELPNDYVALVEGADASLEYYFNDYRTAMPGFEGRLWDIKCPSDCKRKTYPIWRAA